MGQSGCAYIYELIIKVTTASAAQPQQKGLLVTIRKGAGRKVLTEGEQGQN